MPSCSSGHASSGPQCSSGIELGTGIGEYLDGNPAGLETLLRLISLSEVLISARLLPAFSNLGDWLRKPRLFLRFIAALVLGPAVSGIFAALLFHTVNRQRFLTALDGWAAADALGIAATMPLVLALRTPEMRALFRPAAILRTVTVLTLVLLVATVTFSVTRYPLLFLLYPALLLTDTMLAFAGSAIAAAAVSFLSVYFATHGIGPFANWPHDLPVSRDVALQLYLGFHMVALFPASILVMERKRMATEILDNNAQLLMLASLDALTGIPNRRSLEEHFTQEWKRAIRLQTSLGLIMIDIDHFKQFNDFYGHHAGDECLQAVAAAIASETRRVQDHAARYGGEEFALLLPHTDLPGTGYVAEAVRLAVTALRIPHRGSASGYLTVSVGYATMIPILGEAKLALLQMADAALYTAKRSGSDKVARFTARETVGRSS